MMNVLPNTAVGMTLSMPSWKADPEHHSVPLSIPKAQVVSGPGKWCNTVTMLESRTNSRTNSSQTWKAGRTAGCLAHWLCSGKWFCWDSSRTYSSWFRDGASCDCCWLKCSTGVWQWCYDPVARLLFWGSHSWGQKQFQLASSDATTT